MAALGARTDGWAAGLHLAALSLRSQADLDAALAAFAGSDRTVVGYFVEEVLARLPDRTRVFLVRTSILDRLTDPLCDAVVGEGGSAALLEELERANAFITPLDGSRQWYRYHHLFADALRHRLRRDEPALSGELHLRASAWYEANGLYEPALEHALAARHWDRAADLTVRLFAPLKRRGEDMTVSRWLCAVPDELVRAHPGFSRVQAVLLLMGGDASGLAAFLAKSEPALEQAGEHAALGVLLAAHARLAANRDDVEEALMCAERALRLLREAPIAYPLIALNAIVQCHLLRGDVLSAGRALERAHAVTTPDLALLFWSQGVFGAECRRLAGESTQAVAAYTAVLEVIGERAVYPRHQAWLGLAGIARERNRLDEAEQYFERIAELQRFTGRTYHTLMPERLLVRARLARTRDRATAAGESLGQAEAAARTVANARVPRLVRAERAWLALADGRLTDAVRWADELDLAGIDAYAREPEALILARVRRAQGAAAEVAPLLERLLASAEQLGRIDSVIAILVQLALVRELCADGEGGLAALERALGLAESGGYVRVFLDEGEPLLALLRRPLGRGGRAAFATRLLRQAGVRTDVPVRSPGRLTPREHEVLDLLALGLSNRAIAERLVTTEGTIKSHVHRLFGKLGVASRAQALVRARELGALGAVSPQR